MRGTLNKFQRQSRLRVHEQKPPMELFQSIN